jgi:hypothetical protein
MRLTIRDEPERRDVEVERLAERDLEPAGERLGNSSCGLSGEPTTRTRLAASRGSVGTAASRAMRSICLVMSYPLMVRRS